MKKLFTKQIQEMISNGILKEVDESYPKRYLPLLAVTDLERESTKVRVCLDARTRHQNISMNDVLLKGRLEIPNILTIIMKYRTGEIVLIGDIQKMYWQIKIHESDHKYHGIVWNAKTFVFTRICFGEKPSSPIAEESMIRVSQAGKNTHPEAFLQPETTLTQLASSISVTLVTVIGRFLVYLIAILKSFQKLK